MKGVWWASVAGLAAVVCYATLAASPQKAVQQEFVAPGFNADEVRWVKRTHAELVKSLDDIDLTKGVSKEVQPDGSVVEKHVEPSFGFGRVAVVLNHPGRNPEGTLGSEFPTRLVGIGAHGKPLTSDNLRAYGIKDDAFVAKLINEASERLETLQKGEDVAAILDGQSIWMKPLKLTKTECLPCHEGMKVGQTVGVVTYLATGQR